MNNNRIIKSQEEYELLCEEFRNRQYEPNPIKVDISDVDFARQDAYDWNKEYLEIIRVGDIDFLYERKYIYENNDD